MPVVQPRELEIYRTPNGQEPYVQWFESIPDLKTRTRIQAGIDRIESGNFNNCESVGGGVFELCYHFGPGYRVYFGQIGNTIVLLLYGGDKSSQVRDIKRAKAYLQEYKEQLK